MGDNRQIAQVPADVSREIRGGSVSPVAVLLERLADDDLDVSPQPPVDRAQAQGLFIADDPSGLVEHFAGNVVGQTAHKKLERDDAHGIDVAACIEHLADSLLRAHVGNCPDDAARIGLREGPGIIVASDAEIEYLRLPATSGLDGIALAGTGPAEVGSLDKNIAGFQIAVHQAAAMGVLQGIAYFRDQLQPLTPVEPFGLRELQQRQPLNQFHDEVRRRLRVRRGVGIVDPSDSPVAEPTEHLGFAVEPADGLRSRDALTNNLQRHAAAGVVLLGFVDGSHTALADLSNDGIASDLTD